MSLTDRQLGELHAHFMAFQQRTGVTRDEIESAARHAAVSHPRQEFMLLLRNSRWSLTDIGLALGRDHSTVVYGINQAKARRRYLAANEER